MAQEECSVLNKKNIFIIKTNKNQQKLVRYLCPKLPEIQVYLFQQKNKIEDAIGFLPILFLYFGFLYSLTK